MQINKFILLIGLILHGCVVQFLPQGGEEGNNIVVDGLITDQNNSYIVEISKTSPLGKKFTYSPIKGCLVTITDDFENQYLLKEKKAGQYFSDSLTFRGVGGRKYTLHITSDSHQYESSPMEMKPVPSIDSLYAEVTINDLFQSGKVLQGYQVYVNTHDPANECRFYRWNFTETWEFSIPYTYPTIVNYTCWKTVNSNQIYVDNISSLIENKVSKFPLNFITTETDRLKVKYSLLLRQYSLNEDEYNYWEKLKKINEEVGGIYDVVPMSIESNIFCTDSPSEKVLGFFSVSSVSSKRIFIKNSLSTPFKDLYASCPSDTVPVGQSIPGLGISVWIIARISPSPNVFFYVLTRTKGCADCTVNGSNKKPDFWNATKDDVVIQSVFK
jgi:hypothetical protein